MRKIILGISGNIGAGKETAVNYIEEKYDGGVYIFSDTLRAILEKIHLPYNRKNLALLAQTLRDTFGEDILSQALYQEVKGKENKMVMVDGFRREEEVKYFQQFPEFKLIFIDADMRTRYERLVKRNQKVDDSTKTFEEFENDHKRESDRQTENLKTMADYVIDNSGTLEDLYKQLDEAIEKITKQRERIS